ncbi:Piso0_001853 [Millerozyma farinosa CBS 7064]|uniref:Conserved oligomeric Golgi complex subunit 6 n=1 Tax=Pichia sorbitophila (strain ATCC MYA-4447 / BCRC 22081 / CBS 7064 / NBRC 10061 / NRRL Y-12695) TaxID=559304 RepID=G8YP97_PICSO|nr:Piso0_001853 [Millerozyma farinosa CBS 7064]
MDFVDFDTFSNEDIPQPQPSLVLPITSNIENLGKRFSHFNNLTRNLLKKDGNETVDQAQQLQSNEKTKKYVNESLDLLNELEAPSDDRTEVSNINTSSSGLSTRLSRVLNSSLSDNILKEIFENLEVRDINSDYLVEPDFVGLSSRKKLRGEIEYDLTKTQALILKEYDPHRKKLYALESDITKLNNIYESLTSSVEKDFDLVKQLVDNVGDLNRQNTLLLVKKRLLSEFKSRFVLNEYQEFVLQNETVNDEFFEVLNKAEKMQQDCSILLSIDNSDLGQRIMSQLDNLINQAIERIISHVNKSISGFYLLHTKSRLSTVHKCLQYLKKNLNHFIRVMNSYTQIRSKTIVDDFLTQLNGDLDRGVSSDNRKGARPIILSAHDPVRFIGDMLAYVHSVVVNESEMISIIFFDQNEEIESPDYKTSVLEANSKVLHALSRPLKTRIDQMVSSEFRLSTIYSIYNLVSLYKIMLSKQIQHIEGCPSLLESIDQLIASTQQKFQNDISNKLATIKSSNSAQLELNSDLQPPEWLIEFYAELLPIIDSSSSDTFMDLPAEKSTHFMDYIVDEPIKIFDLHLAKNMAKILSKSDQLIMKLNFLDLILSKIMPIRLMADKIISINELISEFTQQLVNSQLIKTLDTCKMVDFYNIINMICPFSDDFFDTSIYQPITENKFFNEDSIRTSREALTENVPTLLMDSQNDLMKLNSPLIANEVSSNSFLDFVKFYLKFGLIVQEFLKCALSNWSDEEIATLLGVEEEYSETKKQLALE